MNLERFFVGMRRDSNPQGIYLYKTDAPSPKGPRAPYIKKYQPSSEKRADIYKMARGPGGPGIKFVASSARKEGHLMWPSSCAGL